MKEYKEKVIEKAEKEDVKLISLQFTDILGTVKSLTITFEHLEEVLNKGVGFDGSSIEGFVRIYESDLVARPDPTTFRILPWRPKEKREARMICNIYRPGGVPFEGDPRYILQRVEEEARRKGFVYHVGPELEFFLFKLDEDKIKLIPHDVGSYFDLSPIDLAIDVKRDAIFYLQDLGLDIEMAHHEVAPSQHEIDFKHANAKTTADNVITFKTTIKEVALNHGLEATFMPKPIVGINGSGMHTHQSLLEEKNKKNAFFDPDDEYNLSETAYYFMAGQLKHIREMSAILAPTVNSYKRLVPGYEAPVYICWGRKNRSALIRIPEYFPGNEKTVRLELRCPDPSCNPYLAFAAMLKAGLDGIDKKIEVPDPVEEDVYEFDDKKLAKLYIHTLPSSLGEAVKELEKSKLMKEALGEFVFEKYLTAKKSEWNDYKTQVSEWELRRYLRY